MSNPVRVELGTEALGDDVDEVVLEVLGDARDEGDADRGSQEQAYATKELPICVVVVLRGVVVVRAQPLRDDLVRGVVVAWIGPVDAAELTRPGGSHRRGRGRRQRACGGDHEDDDRGDAAEGSCHADSISRGAPPPPGAMLT